MTSCEELRDILENRMVAINGHDLNIPMTNDEYELLRDKFDEAEEACNQIARRYIQMDEQLQNQFQEHDIIVGYSKVLHFFNKYKLIDEIDIRQANFETFIE